MSRVLDSAKTKGKAYSKMNQRELVHLWANNMIPKEITKGDYVFNPTEIWFNTGWKGNTKIAEHRELPSTFRQEGGIVKTSVVYLLSSFDNRGSFGNGLNCWQLQRAIPPEKLAVTCKVIPGKDTKGEDWFLWMSNEYHEDNVHEYNKIAWLKEAISNNRIPSIHSLDVKLREEKLLRQLDPETYTRIINTEITQEIEYKHYSGWGSTTDIRQRQKITFKPVDFKLETFFTEHEIEVLKMKEWRDKYDKERDSIKSGYNYKTITTYAKSLKEMTKIWFDPIERERYCKAREEKLAADKESERLAKLKRREKDVQKALLEIDKWRESKNRSYMSTLGYTLLKLSSEKTVIVSSQSMIIQLEEAKKALRLFRAKETRHELVQGFKYNGIQVRNIPYLNEEGEVAYRMENCLCIGCHTVPESEIKAFLEFYKLEW